jgi:hypothetical protein
MIISTASVHAMQSDETNTQTATQMITSQMKLNNNSLLSSSSQNERKTPEHKNRKQYANTQTTPVYSELRRSTWLPGDRETQTLTHTIWDWMLPGTRLLSHV